MRLLDDLRDLGFQVEAVGDKLRVRHPAPTPPESGRPLLEELRQRKAEVLAALAAPTGLPAQTPTTPDALLDTRLDALAEPLAVDSGILGRIYLVVDAAQAEAVRAAGGVPYLPGEVAYLGKVRTERPEAFPGILRALHQAKTEMGGTLEPPATPSRPRDPCSPWPAALPGLGPRTVGPFETCIWCQAAGTWARYGGIPTCLSCARKAPQNETVEEARATLHFLLSTWSAMDESRWIRPEAAALFDNITAYWEVWPAHAGGWFDEWRAAHPEAKLT